MDVILSKKGCVGNISNAHVILINENGEEVRVNKIVYVIWDMCKGIHFDELLTAISLGSNEEANRLRSSLERLINKLNTLNLLEIIYGNVPKN